MLPLDKIVLNTEAHPFPRFALGKLFSTGWKRKPRDAEGNIRPDKVEREAEQTHPGSEAQTQVIEVARSEPPAG